MAYPNGNPRANKAPSRSTWAVSGRVSSSAATSPAAQHPMVASQSAHASTFLVRGGRVIASSRSVRLRHPPIRPVRERYDGFIAGRPTARPAAQSSSAIRLAARVAPSVSTGR